MRTIKDYQLDGINIEYLNIETYHNSLYKNLKKSRDDGLSSSYPNSPFDEFENAYKLWTNGIFSDKKKIIMGVDFGNTIQIVDTMNKVDISTTQIIDFPENSQMDSLMLSEINPITSTPIKDICFLEDPNLYSWPWNNFSKFFKDLNTSAEFCANTTNSFNYPWTRPWTRKFDDQQNPQSK